jgi:hypothetical protein
VASPRNKASSSSPVILNSQNQQKSFKSIPISSPTPIHHYYHKLNHQQQDQHQEYSITTCQYPKKLLSPSSIRTIKINRSLHSSPSHSFNNNNNHNNKNLNHHCHRDNTFIQSSSLLAATQQLTSSLEPFVVVPLSFDCSSSSSTSFADKLQITKSKKQKTKSTLRRAKGDVLVRSRSASARRSSNLLDLLGTSAHTSLDSATLPVQEFEDHASNIGAVQSQRPVLETVEASVNEGGKVETGGSGRRVGLVSRGIEFLPRQLQKFASCSSVTHQYHHQSHQLQEDSEKKSKK